MLTHLLVITGQLYHFRLHPQRRQRATQFVGGVRSKTAFTHQQRIDSGKQSIKRIDQWPDFGRYLTSIQRRGIVRCAFTQPGSDGA
ncbi:hypothetical protein D3C75_1285030 [compost metagenome]